DAVTDSWLMPGGRAPRLRYLPTRANGQLALATYRLEPADNRYVPIALDVLTLRDTRIADITAFRTPEVFPRFGLPRGSRGIVNEERGLTERIARACASRPWLTIGAWAVILAGAIACLALVMTGLTTEGKGKNKPQSERAEDRMLAAFPPDPSRAVTDLVVV